jgi:hypothetical protein
VTRWLLILVFALSPFLFSVERGLAPSSTNAAPEKVIRQRLSRPLLLDRQTILKTDSTDASINLNVGQNKGRLPGSGVQASQKILPGLKAVYESNLLLPYWSDNVSSDRYLHQDRISMEWNLLSRTSLQTSYTGQSEHATSQQKSTVTESKQKDFGLKGALFKNSLWETGYRIVDTERDQLTQQTNLWYASWHQPVTSSLGLLFQSEYRESGDPTQDWNNQDKRLNLGSGANYQINDAFSAQLRFDLKMQEEQQMQSRTWVPEEKRITFSIKGAF